MSFYIIKSLGIKVCFVIIIFIFIWIDASSPLFAELNCNLGVAMETTPVLSACKMKLPKQQSDQFLWLERGTHKYF